MPQTTAMAAKRRKRIASILVGYHRYQQRRNEEIDNRHGEHEGPREAHQLVIAEPRKRRADPDKHKQDDTDLRREPEQRQKNRADDRGEEDGGTSQEHNARDRKC